MSLEYLLEHYELTPAVSDTPLPAELGRGPVEVVL